LSIDYFGAGYSSLAYLKKLAVHELKIDKSFVLGMEESGADFTIVDSVISLVHDLGLTVVAEGIETELTLAMLLEFGCDVAQGFHCGKPMLARDFESWVLLITQQSMPAVRSRRRSLRAYGPAASPRALSALAVAQSA
jgi:EAL domain-containing protein (putative c-di-GMP-specific phosphodiesterase class I)